MIFSVQPTFLHDTRQLSLLPGRLTWSRPNGKEVVWEKEEIESYRYKVEGIRGYAFWICRKYIIEICNHKQEVVRIQLWSLYGLRRQVKYIAIIQTLNARYFNDMAVHYIQLLGNDLSFALWGVGLSPDGIADAKLGEIPWQRLGIKPYAQYFALYDLTDQINYRAFEYGIDWNAGILQAVVEYATNRHMAFQSRQYE